MLSMFNYDILYSSISQFIDCPLSFALYLSDYLMLRWCNFKFRGMFDIVCWP